MIWTRKECTGLACSEPYTRRLPMSEDLNENSPLTRDSNFMRARRQNHRKRAAFQFWTPENTAIKYSSSSYWGDEVS